MTEKELNAETNLDINYLEDDELEENKNNRNIKMKKYLDDSIDFVKKHKLISAGIIIILLLLIILLAILLRKSGVERFYGIIPSFIKPNSLGYFESNKNGLENIPKSKIMYKREESSYIQEIEQKQMNNIEGNIGTSIQADIAIFHCKLNFDAQINEITKKNRTFIYYIVKYIYGVISIKTEDIKLDKYFLNKINKIADEKESDDKTKAIEIDKLFESYGFYVPQKIYLGASYVIEIDKSQISESGLFDIKGKAQLDDDEGGEVNYNNKKIINFLNKNNKTNIIGGNKYAKKYEDWKYTIDEDNMEIIGYDNFIEVSQLLDYDLKKKIKIPLKIVEKKYKEREEYYKLIKNLKEVAKTNKNGGGSSSQGICDKNQSQLIYSKKIDIDVSWNIGDSTLYYDESFNDIIVGWKMNSLEKLNGKWTVNGNPILKHEISIQFERSAKIFGLGWDIEIFLMKNPEINN